MIKWWNIFLTSPNNITFYQTTYVKNSSKPQSSQKCHSKLQLKNYWPPLPDLKIHAKSTLTDMLTSETMARHIISLLVILGILDNLYFCFVSFCLI